MSLYDWLHFFHVSGLAIFLFAHGVSGGASLATRGSVAPYTRQLLQLARRSNVIANPALLLVILTGVWMTFLGAWWGRGWVWASIVVLIVVIAAMFYVARPYYVARAVANQSDEVLSKQLQRTRPLTAVWVGGLGVLLLIGLMVLKPF